MATPTARVSAHAMPAASAKSSAASPAAHISARAAASWRTMRTHDIVPIRIAKEDILMHQDSRNPHGIFCLETIWFDERSNPSTRSLLELLERLQGVPFVYRDISTWEEMDFCLGRWVGRSMFKKDYQLGDLGILYLGFHGSAGEISLRADTSHRHDEDEVRLEEIGESLTRQGDRGKDPYDCSGCVIHFASCSVLRSHAQARKFKEQVGAACVSGYTKTVYAIDSWAFELIYLALISELLKKKNVNTGTLSTLDKNIKSKKPEYSGLAKKLGFTMIY